jgi:thiamine-phosphate pyrophosphorylase
MLSPGLYGIADASWGDPLVQARILAEEGVGTIQLRCKGWPTGALAYLVEQTLSLGPTILLNDQAALAASLGIGAHLGQEDGPDPAVLSFFGRSTHDLQQVQNPGLASYIGFGPVFSSTTKAGHKSPRGLALLQQASLLSKVPTVAIGGIDLTNIDQVRSTGVHAWAVIGAIWSASDPRAAIRKLS